ncbi:MAG: hypothetical protein ACR2KN_07240 [Geodermatophilaceae bacterium]
MQPQNPTGTDPGSLLTVGGRYQLLARSGADEDTGVGRLSTWRARDTLLRRDVMLRMHSPGGEVSRGFIDRALSAGVLSHPSLAMVYDAVDESRRAYVVSEWVAGVSLADTLRDGPLAERDARETVRRVAEGVAQAHGLGLPVGGLVPERVILTPVGSVAVAGIPAPQASFAADVRALGSLLFASLAGFPPPTEDPAELSRQLANGAADDLAEVALAALGGRVGSAQELAELLVAGRRHRERGYDDSGLAFITERYEYDVDESVHAPWPTIGVPGPTRPSRGPASPRGAGPRGARTAGAGSAGPGSAGPGGAGQGRAAAGGGRPPAAGRDPAELAELSDYPTDRNEAVPGAVGATGPVPAGMGPAGHTAGGAGIAGPGKSAAGVVGDRRIGSAGPARTAGPDRGDPETAGPGADADAGTPSTRAGTPAGAGPHPDAVTPARAGTPAGADTLASSGPPDPGSDSPAPTGRIDVPTRPGLSPASGRPITRAALSAAAGLAVGRVTAAISRVTNARGGPVAGTGSTGAAARTDTRAVPAASSSLGTPTTDPRAGTGRADDDTVTRPVDRDVPPTVPPGVDAAASSTVQPVDPAPYDPGADDPTTAWLAPGSGAPDGPDATGADATGQDAVGADRTGWDPAWDQPEVSRGRVDEDGPPGGDVGEPGMSAPEDEPSGGAGEQLGTLLGSMEFEPGWDSAAPPVFPAAAYAGALGADSDSDEAGETGEAGEDPYRERRRRTWLVIAFPVAALLAVVLVALAIGSSFDRIIGSTVDQRSGAASTSAPAGSSTPPSANATTPPPTASTGPLPVTSATVFDPFGDGAPENNGDSPRAFDNDPGTSWSTLSYRGSPQLGNLKPGVGLVFDLGQPVNVSQVKILTDQPGATVEIRASATAATDLASFAVLGQNQLQAETTFPIASAQPARYWLVWITELVPDGGNFSASLAEVSFTGVPAG